MRIAGSKFILCTFFITLLSITAEAQRKYPHRFDGLTPDERHAFGECELLDGIAERRLNWRIQLSNRDIRTEQLEKMKKYLRLWRVRGFIPQKDSKPDNINDLEKVGTYCRVDCYDSDKKMGFFSNKPKQECIRVLVRIYNKKSGPSIVEVMAMAGTRPYPPKRLISYKSKRLIENSEQIIERLAKELNK